MTSFFTFRNRSFWTDFWAENLLSGFFAEDPLVEVLGRSVRDLIYLAGFSVFDLHRTQIFEGLAGLRCWVNMNVEYAEMCDKVEGRLQRNPKCWD